MSADYAYARERMVRLICGPGGVEDPRVLDAMRAVPRHRFLPGQHLTKQAYGDHALPIGEQQTISQPYVVARMTEMLDVQAQHAVLEIGTGSGYQAAILARLARFVFTMERLGSLARTAIERLRQLEVGNVKVLTGFDGTMGWTAHAPYDRILVTAGAARSVPPPLLEQLAVGGKLVVPEGDRQRQRLALYCKAADGSVAREVGEAVVFVPLIGRYGWAPAETAEA